MCSSTENKYLTGQFKINWKRGGQADRCIKSCAKYGAFSHAHVIMKEIESMRVRVRLVVMKLRSVNIRTHFCSYYKTITIIT